MVKNSFWSLWVAIIIRNFIKSSEGWDDYDFNLIYFSNILGLIYIYIVILDRDINGFLL